MESNLAPDAGRSPEPRTPRRDFLVGSATLAAAIATGGLGSASVAAAPPAATLPELPYATDALEPFIDRATMEIHHGKHHAAYIANLEKALAPHEALRATPLETLLAENGAALPPDIRQAVINNGGGHLNHSLFWKILGPKGKVAGAPSGELASAIASAFGDVEKLKAAMIDAGLKRFGSGWSWLAKDKDGRLQVLSTANQDTPLMTGLTPVLGIDVWEHAYYLHYQNRRPDYLAAIWNVVNWDEVARLYGA